jgi:hypothetical protein
MAKHRGLQVVELKGRVIWSIPIVREGDIVVRVEPIGEVHLRKPIRIAINDVSCDAMLFGQGRDEAAVRHELATRLQQTVEEIDRTCALTNGQKENLQLAGRDDIARLFERVAELRLRIKRPYDEEAVHQGELDPSVAKLCQESRPLRRAIESGPFGDGSIFANTLQKILTPAQLAANDAARRKSAGGDKEAQ